MTPVEDTLTTGAYSPTQHGMLVAWGYFAREIGLLSRLAQVPIQQKRGKHTPSAKLTELLVGVLCGIEYLTDLSEGAAPLDRDQEVAAAWQCEAFAHASGVSRTLAACDETTVTALQAALDSVGQPFLDRAVEDLRAGQEPFVLDVDLTGRPVSSASRTFPDAAFGYMDGEIRLGYQLAEICLQTRLFGRQWVSASHHPGNRVSGECLLELIRDAERRLGCHPARRIWLCEGRLATCQQICAHLESMVTKHKQAASMQAERAAALSRRIDQAQALIATLLAAPLSRRQAGGSRSVLNQAKRQVEGWETQLRSARKQEARAQRLAEYHCARLQPRLDERDRLQARCDRLRAENLGQEQPVRAIIRLDAGFSSGENLTELIELGYEVDTKSANTALIQALRAKVPGDTAWSRVGKNAEMVGWSQYQINTCPFPLTVGLERFHTPQGLKHAVLLRYREAPAPDLDLPGWFHDYNGRQTIEAGNKEEKTTFKVQHLMSRSRAGIRIQAQLTVFAANFVRWANEWIRPRVGRSCGRFETALSRPKRLVRVAANSPATVDRSDGRLLVRFSTLSSYGGVVIRLAEPVGPQLVLPLFQSDHFSHL